MPPSGAAILIILYFIMEIKEKTKQALGKPLAEKDWEIKDRTYVLANGRSPLTWTIQTKHTRKKPLLYFDEEKGFNREIRYATNQKSIFVDEQDGYATLGHVIFEDGSLVVRKNQQSLQKLLSLYHPLAGRTWIELNPEAAALDEVEHVELELDALNLVTELSEENLMGILRTEFGSSVTKYTPNQVKRLAFRFAKDNPALFIELAGDDDVQLRNFASTAAELGIIKLTNNNTTFVWATNNKKIMTVPFDENPFIAFSQFLKTDEGTQVYKSIDKKLK